MIYNPYNYCLSGNVMPEFELEIGLKCAYCLSLNNATKFDNCKSCGAPLAAEHGPDKSKRLWKTS